MDDIGSVKSIKGASTCLNTQKGSGGQKPEPKGGSYDPGNTKPPRADEGKVPMPK